MKTGTLVADMGIMEDDYRWLAHCIMTVEQYLAEVPSVLTSMTGKITDTETRIGVLEVGVEDAEKRLHAAIPLQQLRIHAGHTEETDRAGHTGDRKGHCPLHSIEKGTNILQFLRRSQVGLGEMDQKVVEIRVDQITPGMKESHHQIQNLGDNPGGGLEHKGKNPEMPILGAHIKPQELLRGRSHRNMKIGVMKIDLCQEIPQRDQQNFLMQSGHLKVQGWDKAVQKLQVDDQPKILHDLPDYEDTGKAIAPPLARRNCKVRPF
ncbi:hypothetical protein NDU88_001328 [Pleurodeles waltl]|uniref:Uncharacterized protein n=1 Tax=Pleurodeles waltl TaxID=8319 RepID=A0AAV7W061_PLEWA|nr:hypothetical protein NDU88_001328 [Pleurodeles waltl]